MMTHTVSIPLPQPAKNYILHRPPMLLIDDLIDFGDNFAVAKLHIRPELMFFEQQGLPTWTSVEIMAQTISLFAGIQQYKQHNAPKIGYLLGTRKLQLPFSHFAPHSELIIHAEQQYAENGLGMFRCKISHQQSEYPEIQGTLSVYEPPQGA